MWPRPMLGCWALRPKYQSCFGKRTPRCLSCQWPNWQSSHSTQDSPTASAGAPATQAKSAGLVALSDGGESESCRGGKRWQILFERLERPSWKTASIFWESPVSLTCSRAQGRDRLLVHRTGTSHRLLEQTKASHFYHHSAGRAMNRHVKTGPPNTTPHFLRITHTLPHCFLTWSYLLCPQLLSPRPPSLPAFTNSSQLVSLASDWKRVSQKKPAEESIALGEALLSSEIMRALHDAGVAKWQTRRTQNPLSARTCGFKSLLRYSRKLAIEWGLQSGGPSVR